MAGSAGSDRIRVLGLGNDLLADDALGVLAARELRLRLDRAIDVVDTIETGFGLMDHLLGCDRMIVIDAIRTGEHPPGTVLTLEEGDVQGVPGSSPHYVGLFETLAAGRALRLDVPAQLVILAVEVDDCTTVGGKMHPAVGRAVDEVVRMAEDRVGVWCTS